MAADDHQAQLRAAVLFRLDAHHGVVHDVDGDSQERRLEDDSGVSGLSKEQSTANFVRECSLSLRSSKTAGSKEEPSSPYNTFKLFSPKDGLDTQEEEAVPLTQPRSSGHADRKQDSPLEFFSTPEPEDDEPAMKKPAATGPVEKGLKRPASSKGDPPAKKTKQLKRPAAAAEAVEAVEAVERKSEVSKALKRPAATALEDPPPTAAAAGTSPRPDAAGEMENPQNAGMDSSMFPNATRSYKDTTDNWEAGFFWEQLDGFRHLVCFHHLPFSFPFLYPYPVTVRQVFEFVRQKGNLKGEVWRKIVHLPSKKVYSSYAKAEADGFDRTKISRDVD